MSPISIIVTVVVILACGVVFVWFLKQVVDLIEQADEENRDGL